MSTPNLDIDTHTYLSCKQCSAERNIDIDILLAAKAVRPLPPGIRPNGSIVWQEFQPWFVDNYTELEKSTGDERERLELRKLKAEVIKLENFNRTRSKDFISRKLVLKTVSALYSYVFTQFSRYLEQEQPAKCEGMTALQLKAANKDYLVTLLVSLKRQSELWKDATDLGEEAEDSTPDTKVNEDTDNTTGNIPSVQ